MATYRSRQHLAIAIVFTALAFFGVVARLASRRMKNTRLGLDDYLLVIGFILCVGINTLFALVVSHYGVGQHSWEVTGEQLLGFRKSMFASCIILPTCLATSKLSLVVLYNRIFKVTSFRTINYILMAIISAWYIATLFASIFICVPVRAAWDLSVEAKCGDQWKLNISTPIPWVVTDFIVLLAPLPWLKRLHIPRGQKAALFFMFLLGSLTCIVSTVRYGNLWLVKDDPMYEYYNLTVLSTIESSVTVLCASLIASKPALVFITPKKLQSSIESFLDGLSARAQGVSARLSRSHFRNHSSESKTRLGSSANKQSDVV